MALNDVTFVKGQGGLGRPLTGEDHISGLVYYVPASVTTFPSGFNSSNRVKTVFSLEQAEALGIGEYSNETKATGGNLVIATAVVDGSIEVKVQGESIGKVTVTSTTQATVATALRAAINANTSVHGYVASGSGANVALAAPVGKGANINGAGIITTVIVGTSTVTPITNFTGGITDPYVVLWYHIKEFFRVQPKGVLYVGIYEESATFAEVATVQTTFADGKIRQIGVYTTDDFETDRGQIDLLHGVAEDLSTIDKKPLSILFASNMSTITGLPDLSSSTTTGSYVSVVIGQDGNDMGNELFEYTGNSITCLGAALGAVSRSKVSENIGWVKNFNVSENELDVLAFADGTSYRELSEMDLTTLNDNHYVFLRKHVGITGSYFNDSHTAISETSDYATIENNRTIDKAIRNIRTFLIPELNGPLFVDPVSGFLSEDTVAYFQNLASRPLERMQRDQELSGFQVIINPEQDVLSSSELLIVVKLVPVGVARQIKVNIGFTVKIS